MAKAKKILTFIGITALIFAMFEIFYLCFFPKIINIEQKTPFIEKTFNEYTKKSLKIENPELKTYPTFAVKISAKALTLDNQNNTTLFSANNFSVKIQPLNLIFKTLKIGEIKAKDIVLDLSDFQDDIYSGKIASNMAFPININANGALADIENYQILFKDHYLNKNISLKGKKIDIIPIKRNLSQVITDGSLNIDSKICSFNLNVKNNFNFKKNLRIDDFEGNITNIDLQTIAPYLDAFTDYKNAKGEININISSEKEKNKKNLTKLNIILKDISINEGVAEKQILAKGITTVTAKFFANKKFIEIENFQIDNKNFGVLVNGKIQNYKKTNPNLSLKITILPTDAEKAVDFIPHGILKELDIVKECGVSGDVKGNFSVKGKFPKFEMQGNINATNVQATRNFKDTHTGKIDINFHDTKSEIDVEVDATNGAKFLLKGTADVDRSVPSKFDMHTENGNLQLNMVKAILVPISQLFGFELGPVPMFQIKSGTGNAELHISGTKELASLHGFVNIIDGNANFDGINANLEKINLKLDFNDKEIGFKTKTALINNYPLSVYGLCTTLGDINLHIDSNKINSNTLKKIVTTSSLTKDMTNSLNAIEKVSGNIKFSIFLHGHVNRFSKDFAKEMKKLKIDGSVQMFENLLKLKDFGMPVSLVFGKINFTETELRGENLKVKLGTSPIVVNILGNIPQSDNQKSDLLITAEGTKINLNDTLNFAAKSNCTKNVSFKSLPQINANHSLKLRANINDNNIDPRKVEAELKITSSNNKNAPLNVSTGEIIINNGNAIINKLSVYADKSKLNVNGIIHKFYEKKPSYELKIDGSNLSVKTLCEIANLIPQTNSAIKQIKEINGTLTADINATDKGLVGYLHFKNLSFRHIKSDIPIHFTYLPIKFTNRVISFKNIIGEIGRTGASPLFANLDIENYQKIPIIKGSVSVKPTPLFAERYINTKLSHPIKITGDIGINVNINGSIDSLGIFPSIKFNKNADFSYLSTNLGNTDILREFSGEIFLKPNSIDIKKLNHIQYPKAANGKKITVPIWTLNGIFKKQNNLYLPQNVSFITHQKLPAKLLNFVFKKSLIKSGTFDCVVKVKNGHKSPKILGIANISNVQIPLYNMEIKNGNFFADDKLIHLKADGDLISNKFQLRTDIENSFDLPVKIVKTEAKTEYLNLSKLISVINQWSIDSYKDTKLKTAVSTIKISDILVNKGTFSAKHIDFRNCPIEDFQATFSLDKNSVLKIDTENFKIANGNITGSITHNIKSGETHSNLRMKGVDSNIISSSFLGLRNQITGKLDGNANISTIGLNDRDRLKNANGIIGFHMEDGTIPKLGSIEYLLRASTLIRSGLTSLSVNNLIELLKPFKTGNFSKISGCLYVKNGILKDIAVFSQGENLSLYITGDYNIAESESQAIVYGKLGKKTEGLLGPLGNLSASTIFALIPHSDNITEYEKEISKIPDIDYKNQDVRVFRATVDGDINLDKVSTSFKWIK